MTKFSRTNYYVQAVENMLDAINAHPRRDLTVPWGFLVDDVDVEDRTDFFSGELETWICVDMRVPVIYTPGRVPVRAQLPADRRNLQELERWISRDTQAVPRTVLRDFRASPQEAPDPRTLHRDDDPHWAVTAAFEVV